MTQLEQERKEGKDDEKKKETKTCQMTSGGVVSVNQTGVRITRCTIRVKKEAETCRKEEWRDEMKEGKKREVRVYYLLDCLAIVL